MNILFTVLFLDGYHGSVMHILEYATYLNSYKGEEYNVEVATIFATNEIRDNFKKHGIKVTALENVDIDKYYDIVFAYHFLTIDTLIGRGLRCQKLVLGSLSPFEKMETLPCYWDNASLIIVNSEETKSAHHKSYDIPLDKIYVYENLIPDQYAHYDSHRILPTNTPNKIAVVSNHVPEELIGLTSVLPPEISIDFIGLGQKIYQEVTPKLLANYDVIISIGKTIQYGLGLGIPVFEYDYLGGNGYITLQNFNSELNYNFSGRPLRRKLSTIELYKELFEGYNNSVIESVKLRQMSIDKLLLSSRINQLMDIINQSNDFSNKSINKFELSQSIGSATCIAHFKAIIFNNDILISSYKEQNIQLQNTINGIYSSKAWKLTMFIKKIWVPFKKIYTFLFRERAINKCTRFLNYIKKCNYKKAKIVCVLAVKNEEKYLKDFFSYIKDYVDGFIVLDDGSTDNSLNIIKSEKKIFSLLTNEPRDSDEWDEPQNRIRLLNEAKKFGNIALCCDPDERFEEEFLKNLKNIGIQCLQNPDTSYATHVRELWDTPWQYRCDGIWDNKRKDVIFCLQNHMTFNNTMAQNHHIPWYHDEIKKSILLDYNLYHLKMINKDNRIKRYELYEKLDPHHKLQTIGYKYLIEEECIELKSIPPLKSYKMK